MEIIRLTNLYKINDISSDIFLRLPYDLEKALSQGD
jgi:hypothetical protein